MHWLIDWIFPVISNHLSLYTKYLLFILLITGSKMKKDFVWRQWLKYYSTSCLFVCACVYISFRDLWNICSPNTEREKKLEIFRKSLTWDGVDPDP